MLKNRPIQFWSVLKIFKNILFISVISFNVCTATPTVAADKITLSWGLLKFSLSVKSLEIYARSGKVEPDLNFFLTRIKSRQRKQFQQFLQAEYEVNPVTVARLAYTSVGTKLLYNLGEIIKTPQQKNGFYSLRSAVILAAREPKGITPIALLHQLPTDLEINLIELIKLNKQINHLFKQTESIVARIETKDRKYLHHFNSVSQFKNQGKFQIRQQTLSFKDRTRNRQLVLDLYQPQLTSTTTPVIIISNGLGAKRDRFQELAQHLASYGFAVITLDHPGSDRDRQRDFYRGLYRENFDAREFIDRPLDISFILDRLQQLNHAQFHDQLNLQRVGVFGYSFGGTTALSLAGAEINFARLKKDCNSQTNLLNISLLYQCRALELSKKPSSLKDDRIEAIYLFVPFGNSLFDKTQMQKINIPVFWETSDRDFITPLLLEQIPAFNKLSTQDKYLVIATGLPHTYATQSKQEASVEDHQRKIAEAYHRALSTSFFQTYLINKSKYRHFLNSESIHALGESPYNLHLVDFKLHYDSDY